MKRNHYFIFVLLAGLLINVINCGPQPEIGIKFEEEVFNFGTKDEGIDIDHTFVFTNIGKQPLEIQEVKPTCGCTVAQDWDKVVAPGKKGKIPITFKTTGYQGDVEKVINVTTNIPDRTNIPLTIKVKVVSPIAIVPNNVWLGEVHKDNQNPLTGSFEIVNNLNVPLKILEITPPDQKTRLNLTTVEENKKFKVDFTIDPPFEGTEVVRGQFTVKTNNKKHELIYPSFSYFMVPPIQVFPNIIYLENTQLKDSEVMRSINVRSNIKEPIQILDLKFDGDRAIKYKVSETTKNEYYLIEITVPKGLTLPEDKPYTFTFKVKNDPTNTVYSVPLQIVKN